MRKMNKTLFLFLGLLSLVAGKTYAQSFEDRLHFEISEGAGLKMKSVTPLDFSFKAQVDIIPRMYVFATAEANKSFYKKDDVKTYFSGESLGGGLAVKLLDKKKTSHALDVRLKVLSSIGHADWKRTTYDASLAWYFENYRFTPVVECGYRFIDSRTDALSNYSSFYVTLGIRY